MGCPCSFRPLRSQVPRFPRNILHRSRPSSLRFPLHDFKSYFTLLSEFFSSFVHTTCSLSVSCQYLALGGHYLPLCAALPSNATRRRHQFCSLWYPEHPTGLSPSLAAHSKRTWTRHTKASPGLFMLQLSPHSPRPQGPRRDDEIFTLGFSRFTRRYWGNHCYFLFLRLLRCFNSAGNLI